MGYATRKMQNSKRPVEGNTLDIFGPTTKDRKRHTEGSLPPGGSGNENAHGDHAKTTSDYVDDIPRRISYFSVENTTFRIDPDWGSGWIAGNASEYAW